jgi:hypothetical protein
MVLTTDARQVSDLPECLSNSSGSVTADARQVSDLPEGLSISSGLRPPMRGKSLTCRRDSQFLPVSDRRCAASL